MLCPKNNLRIFQILYGSLCMKLFDSRLKSCILDDLIMESTAVFPQALRGDTSICLNPQPSAVTSARQTQSQNRCMDTLASLDC